VVVGALVFVASLLPVDRLVQALAGLGAWGFAGFAAVYVLAAVLFVPVWILNVAAGVAFGFLRGAPVAVAGANLAAVAAFLLTRALGRERFEHRLGERVDALDRAIARKGFRVALLLRLAHLPFAPLNLALALTRVSLRDYVLATALGMLPGILVLAYAGSVLGSATGVREAVRERGPLEWTLLGVAALAAVACAVVLTRIARRTLGRHAHGAWT
jgi:uncharacterized membrane protein YdjX (TVP38/TMEM64 family)